MAQDDPVPIVPHPTNDDMPGFLGPVNPSTEEDELDGSDIIPIVPHPTNPDTEEDEEDDED